VKLDSRPLRTTLISSGQYELNGLRRLDPQIITAVYDWYYPDVYRFVRYRLGDEALSEDIAGKVFIHLLEGLKSGGNPQTRLNIWLLRIASHTVSDYLWQSRLRPTDKAPDGTPGVEQGEWQRLIAALPEEQQELLALRFGLGYSLEETAVLMKKNVHVIQQLQFHTLAGARPQIKPTAITDDKLYDTLELGLQALEHGIDVETWLARLPARSDELRPILETAFLACEARIRDVPPDAMQHGRARVLRRAAEMREQGWRALMFIPFWFKPEALSHSFNVAFTSVATATLLVAGGTAVIYVPVNLPSIDNVYPVNGNFEKKFEPEHLQEIPKLVGSAPAGEPEVRGPIEVSGRISGPEDVKPVKTPKLDHHPGSGGGHDHDDHDHHHDDGHDDHGDHGGDGHGHHHHGHGND
jgi:RNA polymerase sigma factor (sigma-70 family)